MISTSWSSSALETSGLPVIRPEPDQALFFGGWTIGLHLGLFHFDATLDSYRLRHQAGEYNWPTDNCLASMVLEIVPAKLPVNRQTR